MAVSGTLQRSRWVLTLNNYNPNMDYKQELLNPSFKIRRAVIGKEVGANDVQHLQGYVEYERSYRLSHCKKVLGSAFWEVASESSLVNFRYCTKDGNYFTIGDFSREEAGNSSDAGRSCSVPLLIKGLINKHTAAQVKVSKEYFERHHCFDKIANMVKNIKKSNELFAKWQTKKLFLWQYQCLKIVMEQPERKITWIADLEENYGKSFFAQYLSVLYGFTVIDGSMSCRDAAFFVDDESQGFCFDVARSSKHSFDYSTLESLKNGLVMSGKYAGRIRRFTVQPVVVFANFHPDYSALSMDRWDVHTLGTIPFADMSKEAVISPKERYSFNKPPTIPNLSEDFDLRDYLEKNTSENPDYTPDTSAEREAGTINLQMQVTRNETDQSCSSPSLRLVQNNHPEQSNCPHRENGTSTSQGCACLRNTTDVATIPAVRPQPPNEMESSGESIELPPLVSDSESLEQSSHHDFVEIEPTSGSSPFEEMIRLNSPASPVPIIEMPGSPISQIPCSLIVPASNVLVEEVTDGESNWQIIPKNKPKTSKSSTKRKRSSKKVCFDDSDEEPITSSQSKIVFSKDGQMTCKKNKKSG